MIKNEEKITKAFCQGKDLVFCPQTAVEATFIQHKIFEMGYSWANQAIVGVRYEANDFLSAKGLHE